MNLSKIAIIIIITTGILDSCKSQSSPKFEIQNQNKVRVIPFTPGNAGEVPFDSIFSSLSVIDLQNDAGKGISILWEICRTDSYLVARTQNGFSIFDTTGRYLSSGKETRVRSGLFYPIGFFANDRYILAFNGINYVKYDLTGIVVSKGETSYSIRSKSFYPLNDSTWIFYSPRIVRRSDSLRLWTTDANFQIRKEYLHHNMDLVRHGTYFSKNIHNNGKELLISEEEMDTIYRFEKNNIKPEYVFNMNGHKVRDDFFSRNSSSRDLATGEAFQFWTIVTAKVILKQVSMDKRYLIYYNRSKDLARTITGFSNGPDLLNFCQLVGSDSSGRLYWILKDELLSTSQKSAQTYNSLNLLRNGNKTGNKSGIFLIITKLK